MKFIDDHILNNAVDMHIHVGPDYSPRYADAIRVAREAAAADMAAIVIKQHLASTVAAAYEAGQVVPEIKVFGGVALNAPCGGLSARSVLACVNAGGKMIWLPTVDAAYNIEKAGKDHWIKAYVNGSAFGQVVTPLYLLDTAAELKPEVKEIMTICHQYGAVLGSGHAGPQECLALARYANDIGYTKLEITHVNAWTEDFTPDICRELAANGATLSIAYGVCSPHNGRQDPREIAEMIRDIGAQHFILITDSGSMTCPPPPVGMRGFYYLLQRLGVSSDELHTMMVTNPARLLDLDLA